jgi:hypothetical protein
MLRMCSCAFILIFYRGEGKTEDFSLGAMLINTGSNDNVFI